MLSVGEILKKERQRRGLTLLQIEKDTRIRVKFLQAIEDNNWSYFSSKIYISGIIKNYAKYLSLDQNKMLAFFRRDYERKEDLDFTRKVSPRYLSPETKIVGIIGLVCLFLLFAAYFGYQVKLYLQPPKISVLSPTTAKFRNIDKLHITGKTDKESTVTILGEHVFLNREGNFEYDLPLKKGINSVTIDVTGANGKKSSITKSYILE